MANVTIAASVFTLMAISFDRYIAIVRPLKPRMTKSEARNFIIFIWGSSMLLALPCLLYSTTVSIRYKNNEIRRGCFLLWPDGKTSISYREYVYNIVFFATTYLLPMLVMLVSYSLIGCELWGSHSIGELTDRQANSIKSKRRVVRMFIVIVVVFMLCWLPQQGFFLYQYHNNQVLDTANIQHIYLGFYWLAMANAMVNPIIYYWMNARFRSYFREVVTQCRPGRTCCCCCCCCPRSNSYFDSPPLTRRRCDSADHTSRSRSDGNGVPRCIVSGVPRHNNHLLVYSSRGKVNIRGGGLNQHSCSRADLVQTDSFRLRDFSYKPALDNNGIRKPLRAEKDWHYIQHLSDQKALRMRNIESLSKPIHRVNGYQRPQSGEGTTNNNQAESVLTESTKLMTPESVPNVKRVVTDLDSKPTISTKSLPCQESCTAKDSSPTIEVNSAKPLDSGSDKLQESAKGINNSHSKQIPSNHDLSELVENEIPDTLGIESSGAVSVSKSNPSTSFSREEESTSEMREDILSNSLAFWSYKENYHKLKYLNGNMVHQAIEETLIAVKKQAYTVDKGGISTTNVVCNSPSGGSLGVAKELML